MCWLGSVSRRILWRLRLGARLILQQALEDEVTDFVGRARYERSGGEREVVYRNGLRSQHGPDDQRPGRDRAPAGS